MQKTDLEKTIEWATDALLAQDENGLFRQRRVTVRFQNLERRLVRARRSLSAGKYAEAQEAIDEFWSLFDRGLNEAGDQYWVKFVHARPIALFSGASLVITLAALALVGSYSWFDGIPYWTILLGSLGGCLRGIWWLFQHVSRKDFRRSWWLWFIVSPFVGAGLGILTYFAFLATVVASTASSQITQPGLAMFLVGFAGFSWDWAVERLTLAGKTVAASVAHNGS